MLQALENSDAQSYGDYGDELSRTYRAAGGSGQCEMLLFVPNAKLVKAPADRFFPFDSITSMEVKKDGRELIIEFGAVTVICTGANLRAVAKAIGARACSRVEAFDGQLRDRPSQATEPFIGSIAYCARSGLA